MLGIRDARNGSTIVPSKFLAERRYGGLLSSVPVALGRTEMAGYCLQFTVCRLYVCFNMRIFQAWHGPPSHSFRKQFGCLEEILSPGCGSEGRSHQ